MRSGRYYKNLVSASNNSFDIRHCVVERQKNKSQSIKCQIQGK